MQVKYAIHRPYEIHHILIVIMGNQVKRITDWAVMDG
ncbi:hypothetical protein QFZ28_005978 [Neobacillus niacini]|nr:hypothetical protein [Neobacillus niacini]